MKRRTRELLIVQTMLTTLVVSISLPVRSEGASGGRGEQTTATTSVWQGGVGDGFRNGARNAGIAAGAGIGTAIFGSDKAHDLALAYASHGWIFTHVVGQGWRRGNGEFRVELFGGAQIDPKLRYVVGFTPVVRYNFANDSPWVPFADFGVGLALTNIKGPDLSTTWEFNIAIGGGALYFFRQNRALSLQYRGVHLSNAGFDSPNHGTNTHMFLLGLNWFY
jgi:hypothetical protein